MKSFIRLSVSIFGLVVLGLMIIKYAQHQSARELELIEQFSTPLSESDTVGTSNQE